MNRKDKRFALLLKLPLYLWTVLFVLAALGYVIGLSLQSRGELIGVSGQWTLDNYVRLREPQYFQVLVNSLRLAALTTLLCALIGYPFGYLMARLKPASRSIVTLLLVVPFWTNSLIRIYGWRILLIGNGPINTLLMNLGWIQQPLKLLNTEGAVFLGMVYALVPFMILPSSTAVEKLDYSVVEAARDLGASPLHAFFTVTVPLTLSGLMAGCVLVFIPSTGLFFLNDLLGGSKTKVLSTLLYQYAYNMNDWMSAAMVAAVMIVITIVINVAFTSVAKRLNRGGAQ